MGCHQAVGPCCARCLVLVHDVWRSEYMVACTCSIGSPGLCPTQVQSQGTEYCKVDLGPEYFAANLPDRSPTTSSAIAPVERPRSQCWRGVDDWVEWQVQWRRLGAWRWGIPLTLLLAALLAVPHYRSPMRYIEDESALASTLRLVLSVVFWGWLISFIGGLVHVNKSRLAPLRRALAPKVAPATDPFAATPGMHTCHYLGGVGLALHPGVAYRFGIGKDHIAVVALDGTPRVHLPFDDILSMSAEGLGAVRSGGGFIGGGFGVEAAAEGMLLAGALNALTSRTTVDSCLRVVAKDAEAVLAFTKTLPAQLDIELSAYRVEQRRRQAVPAQTSRTAALDALERLLRLREAGALTEDEFQAHKTGILC